MQILLQSAKLRDLLINKPSKCEKDGRKKKDNHEIEQSSLESEESLLSLKEPIYEED